ncbi:uncharacterized protein NEMAJ01_1323 [Nematocida major]|uniref:uncharacterized protein n=1 Tax=Nematocida major TaxID=1912982 RepID=UPI002007F53F|nr:uncharacterized protein NEMAJ01_1323 [Nematocida major]KAH9386427.1 hypothetical protein NEMAJ01_1323 [Nematocida major]
MQKPYSNSEEDTGEDSYSDEGSFCSNEMSDLITSSSNVPELFTVCSGPCAGDYDRIELLARQAKTLDVANIQEKEKELLFSKILVRSEAESIEADPWITSFFSVLSYSEATSMLHAKVNAAIKKMERPEELSILVSTRFANVPEEIVYEMYEALPGALPKQAAPRMLLLSLERPVLQDEEKEIKRVFPDFKFATSAKLFPVHTEEIFLMLNGAKPAFSCTVADDSTIKGYVLTEDSLGAFIGAMKKYYT